MSFEALGDSSTTIPIHTWMLALQPACGAPGDYPAGPADAHLLARIAQGDPAAFQIFYERHSARVVAYACKLARDRHLAEDVAQEVFTSVWTRAASFRPERGDAPGWLYTLTRNKFIDNWRRGPRAAVTEEIDDQRLPARQGEEKDLRLTMKQALAHVSPDQRKAIETAYFGGLTYEETADELELPVGTLKSRIRLGLRTMRILLS